MDTPSPSPLRHLAQENNPHHGNASAQTRHFSCMFNPYRFGEHPLCLSNFPNPCFREHPFTSSNRGSSKEDVLYAVGKLPKTNNSSNELHCLKFLQILLNPYAKSDRKIYGCCLVLGHPSLEKKKGKSSTEKILAYFLVYHSATNWGTRFAVNSLAPPPTPSYF
ncbi:hypothetical protein CEXT_518391 [Caerostris extrusa]|uniref:Uncharacterized protein n=1 Tax=Caerostris extrusa TaxID=172846 RepID=A0AAV4MFU0_CAEEX|nr:hypothetical protein CEXT_518391 [Caerostris extrusa]